MHRDGTLLLGRSGQVEDTEVPVGRQTRDRDVSGVELLVRIPRQSSSCKAGAQVSERGIQAESAKKARWMGTAFQKQHEVTIGDPNSDVVKMQSGLV